MLLSDAFMMVDPRIIIGVQPARVGFGIFTLNLQNFCRCSAFFSIHMWKLGKSYVSISSLYKKLCLHHLHTWISIIFTLPKNPVRASLYIIISAITIFIHRSENSLWLTVKPYMIGDMVHGHVHISPEALWLWVSMHQLHNCQRLTCKWCST